MAKVHIMHLLSIATSCLVCAAKSVPPVTFAQAFQFPDWSGFTLKAEPRRKPSSFLSPSSSASSIPRPSPSFMDNKLSAPAPPSRAEARGVFTPYSVSPSDRSLTSSVAHPPRTQWTHFSVSGSKNSYAPLHPALPTTIQSDSIFSSHSGTNTLPPFVPTSQPMKRLQKKHARAGKRIIDPSKKIIHPSSIIVKKMKMNEPGQSKIIDSKSSFTIFPARINPEQMKEMKLVSKKKVPAPINNPSELSPSKTLMKQKRFQKLMRILKKIKHVRRPVKAMKKPMKDSNVQDKFKGNSKNYRIVNEDGSIKWGYRTPSGLFQDETIGADCVTRGVYGYTDPSGVERKYKYTRGNKCGLKKPQVSSRRADHGGGYVGARGPQGHGHYDYREQKFIMEDGRRVIVKVNQDRRARGRRL